MALQRHINEIQIAKNKREFDVSNSTKMKTKVPRLHKMNWSNTDTKTIKEEYDKVLHAEKMAKYSKFMNIRKAEATMYQRSMVPFSLSPDQK
jgi:hypothetical protein